MDLRQGLEAFLVAGPARAGAAVNGAGAKGPARTNLSVLERLIGRWDRDLLPTCSCARRGQLVRR